MSKMAKVVMCLLMIMIVFISGCTSSYKDCKLDCMKLEVEDICADRGGDRDFVNMCYDGFYYDIDDIKRTCFKYCGGGVEE